MAAKWRARIAKTRGFGMHSREIQIEQGRALANERLAAAVAQSREIAEETARIRAIHKKINATLAERDIEWEKKQWFSQNVEALHAWVSGGKLPSVKALDASENELRVLKVALDQIGVKLLVLSAREHMSVSEELECETRLAHLAALEAHFRTEEFLRSGAEILARTPTST